MMVKIIVATVAIGFFAWLSQLLTPVHPKDPRIGFNTTWDGKIAVIKRSEIPTSLHW